MPTVAPLLLLSVMVGAEPTAAADSPAEALRLTHNRAADLCNAGNVAAGYEAFGRALHGVFPHVSLDRQRRINAAIDRANGLASPTARCAVLSEAVRTLHAELVKELRGGGGIDGPVRAKQSLTALPSTADSLPPTPKAAGPQDGDRPPILKGALK